ncbi:STAM-binding protein [Rhodotorula toruloides NP11]|uniref:STAM-binding protein n=1 Tax=Rhodotorula toruloides (strain NP11) TaxID=1130832 RepID=M7WPS4_RHOT1|nr:STAM-binding protein [Rhodotorula toruloides NP11]EMS20061.1 STAM-binding protein [Rhodotorula toruloides NP11]
MAAALLRKRFKRTKQPTADPAPPASSLTAELAPSSAAQTPSSTPPPAPTDPPPRSFAQLADIADEIVASSWDPGLPLRHWVRACGSGVCRAQVYQEEGNYDMAFVRVATILKLLQDVLPRLHPEWRTLSDEQLGAIHQRIATFSAIHASLKSYLVSRTTTYYSSLPSSSSSQLTSSPSPALTLRNTITPAATTYTDSTAPPARLPSSSSSSAEMPSGAHPRRAGARERQEGERRTAIGELRRGLEGMRGLGRPLVAGTKERVEDLKGALPIPGDDAEEEAFANESRPTGQADLLPRAQGRRIPKLGETFVSPPPPIAVPASAPSATHAGPAYPSLHAPTASTSGPARTNEPSAPLPLPGEGESDEEYSEEEEPKQHYIPPYPPVQAANVSPLAPSYPQYLGPSPSPPTAQHYPSQLLQSLHAPPQQPHSHPSFPPQPPQYPTPPIPPIPPVPPVPPPAFSSHPQHPTPPSTYPQPSSQTHLPVPPFPPPPQPSAPPNLPSIPAPSAPPLQPTHDAPQTSTAALGRSRSLSLASTVSRRMSGREGRGGLGGVVEVEVHEEAEDQDDPSLVATTESGAPLRTLFLPERLIPHFTDIVAARNTARNIETCGLLLGRLARDVFTVTHLLVPKQEGTSDTCTTMNEEEVFEFQDRRGLLTLGWIHTHPSQTIFLSSLDLHTHASYQVMLAEAIAVVCSPRHDPSFGVFRLTDPPGLEVVGTCRGQGAFHPHLDLPLYTDVDSDFGHCKVRDLPFECCDLRTGA